MAMEGIIIVIISVVIIMFSIINDIYTPLVCVIYIRKEPRQVSECSYQHLWEIVCCGDI